MRFSILAEHLEKIEQTSKRLEITAHLVELFRQTPMDLVQQVVYLLQGKVRPEYEGVELGVASKTVMRTISKLSGTTMNVIEDKFAKVGDLGVVGSSVLNKETQTTFMAQEITVQHVYQTLYKLAQIEGSRSQNIKIRHIYGLLNDATPREAKFILKILLGTMRLGVAENTIMDALAEAYTGERANRSKLERAYNVSSDLGRVAAVAAKDGIKGVETFGITLYSPIRPMLAERIRTELESIEKMYMNMAAEYKLDGERVQIHMGSRVEIFSRSLERTTKLYPDIVEHVPRVIRAKEAILEAETVAINPTTGDFLPFQELMHRRRKHDIQQAVDNYPISINFFDILYADGRSYLDIPYAKRRQILQSIVAPEEISRLVPMRQIRNVEQLVEFMENSINAGGEGLMLKTLDGPYRAGSRGSLWLKLKREYQDGSADSLDLVIVGAFHGRGRRTGTYGTFLLAAYDEKTDMFTSVCKVGTGFTDEYLDTLYQMLTGHIIPKSDMRVNSGMTADVWFEPEIVIEVVASEVTLSPVHTTAWDGIRKGSGLALRFPKFTGRIRYDKSPQEASSTLDVVSIYKEQKKSNKL